MRTSRPGAAFRTARPSLVTVLTLGASLALAAILLDSVPAAVLAVHAINQGGAPPRETLRRLGVDAQGNAWQIRAAVGEPLLVFGPARHAVNTREPFDLFEIHGIIDARDVAWIVDGRGRGVRLQLADGKTEEFRVPVSMQLIGGIAVRQGKLYFGENPAGGPRSVRQMDIASGTVKTVVTLDAAWSVYTLVTGKSHLWVLNWAGLAGPQDAMELIALDWASGAATTRGRRTMRRAAYYQSVVEVVEADDGAAWVANGYTGRVERLDAAGAWQGWSLDERTPSNLVVARFGAACLLRRLKPPSDTRQLEGMPFERPAVLSREIAAFQPGATPFLTLPVDADVQLTQDRDGSVRVKGRGRLSVEGGRLDIVQDASTPATTSAPAMR